MKAKFIFLSVLLCCMLSATAYAQTHNVSQSEALTIAQRHFLGEDVDYFILENDSGTIWTIFVDAAPMQGWEHDCYLLSIPKKTYSSFSSAIPINKIKMKLPPTGNLVPLSVKNRYGTKANSKPIVKKASLSNAANTAAQRTYAIILSGGVSKMINHERYWNDCSFIYQTLVNKYGVPKENIYPIMSDGTDPAEDVRCMTYPNSLTFKSQDLDLDGDDANDIKLAATKFNISTTLNSLVNKINEDDHLFFFVIDHGGTSDNKTESYINLWGNEKLKDTELANLLDPFIKKHVTVNAVLGQCFSGGFVDNLNKVGCVVATASNGSESSWACPDMPYDEFVYHWTCAANGADHRMVNINADADANGTVTMDEAFAYAKNKDRRDEHPMFNSNPLYVGEDLSFDNLAPAIDIYIKDNPEDTGKEPNMTTNEFWKSPSICVRNADDGIFVHQNPEYSAYHQMAYIYIRIYNRGKKDYTGGKFIKIYWAQASTAITTKTWKGREIYKDANTSWQCATGGALEASYIDTIKVGEYKDVKVRWSLPNSMEHYPEGNFHFCLLGKIMDTPYDDGYKDGVTYFDLRGSNDQAQKNVTIIRNKDVNKDFNVYVRNFLSTQKAYTLELIPQSEADAAIYSSAKVEMSMSPKVYTAWERGGFQSEDLENLSSSSNSTELRRVRLISPQSKVKRITLQGDEFDIVSLKFDFFKYSPISKMYSFDLVQKDEDGNIISGETFVVESPTPSFKPIMIDSQPIATGQIQLNAVSTDFTSYIWKNHTGNNLGEGSSITVSPTVDNSKYTVTAMNEEGEIAEESISLNAICGIQSVSSESGNINVSLKGDAPNNSRITISSIENGTVVADSAINGQSEISINVTNYTDCIYIVSYLIDDIVVDSQKITVVR